MQENVRLLYVGDDRHVGAIGEALAAGGIELRHAKTLPSTEPERGDVHAVLCDGAMVSELGDELAAVEAPLLALVEDDTADTIQRALSAGARDVVWPGSLARLAPAVHREIASARERQQLQQNNWFLNAIIDAIPHILFVKEAETLSTVAVNKTYADILRKPKHEILGKDDAEILGEDYAREFARIDRHVLQTQEVHRFREKVDLGEGERWFGTSKAPLVDENGVSQYVLGITEDVTELYESREKLERSNRELSEIQAQLLDTLRQVSETEDAAVVGELTADIARELRASASGTLAWLEEQLGRQLSPIEAKDALETAVRELRSIVTSLERIQPYRRDARADNRADLLGLVSEATKALRDEFGEDAEVQVVDEGSVPIACQVGDLVTALTDALSYFVDEDEGTAQLVVRVITDEGLPVVEITNPGEDSPPRRLARMFLPGGASGTGVLQLRKQIRLALARRVVQRNAGTLTASSKPGAGTTLRVQLCPAT